MRNRRILIPIFIVIVGVSVLLGIITWPEDKESTELPNGRTLRQNIPISEQVSDLNNDGKKDILDLILEINGG